MYQTVSYAALTLKAFVSKMICMTVQSRAGLCTWKERRKELRGGKERKGGEGGGPQGSSAVPASSGDGIFVSVLDTELSNALVWIKVSLELS